MVYFFFPFKKSRSSRGIIEEINGSFHSNCSFGPQQTVKKNRELSRLKVVFFVHDKELDDCAVGISDGVFRDKPCSDCKTLLLTGDVY